MITDEEIAKLACKSVTLSYLGGQNCVDNLTAVKFNTKDSFLTFARAIYQLGRQHQRKSDADLCDSLTQEYNPDGIERPMEYVCAEAIRNNKEA